MNVWVRRLVGLIIAVVLGLLNPLSCVVHCALHGSSAPAEYPGDVHAVHSHNGALQAVTRDMPANEVSRHTHTPHHAPASDEPLSPSTPRALYELLALDGALLVAITPLAGLLMAPALSILRPLHLAPPTPPPRARTA